MQACVRYYVVGRPTGATNFAGVRRQTFRVRMDDRNDYATATRIACGNGTDAPVAGSTHTITTLPSAYTHP